MSLKTCKLIELRKITDARGNLNIVEAEHDISFPIRRVYYISSVPANVERGGHAHVRLQQLLIAVSGSFDIILNDGTDTIQHTLNDPSTGLYIGAAIWREMKNFSKDTVALVLASEYYDENDYYREYKDFQASLVGQK